MLHTLLYFQGLEACTGLINHKLTRWPVKLTLHSTVISFVTNCVPYGPWMMPLSVEVTGIQQSRYLQAGGALHAWPTVPKITSHFLCVHLHLSHAVFTSRTLLPCNITLVRPQTATSGSDHGSKWAKINRSNIYLLWNIATVRPRNNCQSSGSSSPLEQDQISIKFAQTAIAKFNSEGHFWH